MAYEYINATGLVVPDTSEILTEVQQEYQSAFGSDLVVTPDSPAGVLITTEALARAEVVNNNAALANQINPNIAAGIFLDAIMALTGIQRTAASRTTVTATLAGVASTVIPAGSRAATSAGDLFETVANAIIGGGGTVSVEFQSVETGAVPCPISDLTTVISSILGWETVTNPAAGVPGTATQSDIAARAYRNNTLGFQGTALAVAITSALYEVEGVQSLWFQENTEATTEIINGISMIAHSVYVCVNGGTDLDVAAALLENKSNGAGWNGAEEVEIIEPASGQPYTVKFDRPDEITILVRVTTTNGSEDDIKAAILAYIAGEQDGEPGYVVGGDVSPWELAGAINRAFPSIFLTKVEISYSTPSYTTDVLAIEVDEIAVTLSTDISVVIVP